MGFNQQLDNHIIKRAKKGDMKAIEVIYHTFANPVFTLAYRIIGEKNQAQDVAHDVFIKIIKAIGRFKGSAELGGWIKRIASNETINYLRSANKLTELAEETLEHESNTSLFESNWLDDCQDLEKLLSNLNVRSRAVLLLYEVEGFSHKEIGKMFNQSESFSKVTVYRALKQLRETLVTQTEQLSKS